MDTQNKTQRPIKFRAWNPETKQMKEVLMLAKEFCSLSNPFSHGEAWDRDKLIIMQFTGLKDCKGRDIYEGDVLQGKHHTYPVNYLPSEGRFLAEGKHSYIPTVDWGEYEVIGNVWENPELVEAKL